ncbi:MAG: biotin/lipoyl-containing protein [Planctomycetota bacterium]|nr:biotin/lipoyl-containing protein [Planctomycetota bacterium]
MSHAKVELLVVRDGDVVCLAAPEVGLFTCALSRGAIVGVGESAGVITALGRHFELVVPEGAVGVVANAPPNLVRAPVGYRDVLYRLAAIDSTKKTAKTHVPNAASETSELVMRAPQSGRFYHRPAPAEPPFASVGAIVADGQPIGMIEVMKTFSHVPYKASGTLPKRAKLVRWIANDGADVKSGDALFALERAE